MQSINQGILGNKREDMPHTCFAKAVLVRALMDSLGSLSSTSGGTKSQLSILRSQAKDFFSMTKPRFRLICDIAMAEPSYVIKIHQSLTEHKKRGDLKKFSLKVVVERCIDHL